MNPSLKRINAPKLFYSTAQYSTAKCIVPVSIIHPGLSPWISPAAHTLTKSEERKIRQTSPSSLQLSQWTNAQSPLLYSRWGSREHRLPQLANPATRMAGQFVQRRTPSPKVRSAKRKTSPSSLQLSQWTNAQSPLRYSRWGTRENPAASQPRHPNGEAIQPGGAPPHQNQSGRASHRASERLARNPRHNCGPNPHPLRRQ